VALILAGGTGLVAISIGWGQGGFVALENPLLLILSATAGAIGAQNVLGGFMLAIIGGNNSQFTPMSALGE